MIGGDEVGAVVLDVGAHSTRAGYAGEDVPRVVFPSVVCRCGEDVHVGTTALAIKRDNQTVHRVREFVDSPSACGTTIRDTAALESIVNYAMVKALCVDPTEHPLLFTEPIAQPRSERAALAELCFERHNAPAFFLAKTNVLSAFAAAKATALVVDVGAEATTVAPVHEGYSLRTGAVVSPIAGNAVTTALLSYLEHKEPSVQVRPRFEFRRKESPPQSGNFITESIQCPNVTPSYRAFCVNEIVEDMKHTIMRISHAGADQTTAMSYYLPDGTAVSFSPEERESVGSMFFGGERSYIASEPPPVIGSQTLPEMIMSSIAKCDVDIRHTLYQSIIVTGGGSIIPGFAERLTSELRSATPLFRGKLFASPASDERRFGAWIGGSILGSLGTFHQLWISRAEYNECGKSIVEKRCP